MRADRKGFALILVIVGTAGAFTLAMRGGLSVASSTVEASAVLSKNRANRAAHAAAIVAIKGIVNPTSQSTNPEGASDDLASGDEPREIEEQDLELPEFVREMLASVGKEIEQGAKDDILQGERSKIVQGTGVGSRASGAGYEALRKLGLPANPIEVDLSEALGEGISATVQLSDALGGLNINTVDERTLIAYLRAKGYEPARAATIASEILDWIDEDTFTRPRGAESPEYRRVGVTPRNGRITSLEELLYLPSVTPAVLRHIRGDLTLAGDSRVHLGTASPEVLIAMGLIRSEDGPALRALRSRGPLDAQSAERFFDLDEFQSAKARLESTGYLRVTVAVRLAPDAAPIHFEGIALLSDTGLARIGLRPAEPSLLGAPLEGPL